MAKLFQAQCREQQHTQTMDFKGRQKKQRSLQNQSKASVDVGISFSSSSGQGWWSRVVCVWCVTVRAGREDGYSWACAVCIDPTWPPYVAGTRGMAGDKATPPVLHYVLTCTLPLTPAPPQTSMSVCWLFELQLYMCILYWVCTVTPWCFNILGTEPG